MFLYGISPLLLSSSSPYRVQPGNQKCKELVPLSTKIPNPHPVTECPNDHNIFFLYRAYRIALQCPNQASALRALIVGQGYVGGVYAMHGALIVGQCYVGGVYAMHGALIVGQG